ncbi:MAG: glycerol-3-phosphate acyltransferase [Bacteroidota bacterium]
MLNLANNNFKKMEYFLSLLIGIILGSFPTAYIFLKKYKGIDITESGSGNIGALNSIRVSNSKALGILVFIIDFLKGIITVLLIELIFGDQFLYKAIGLAGAVLSHCYSFWLKFKGGRGLAAAAGGGILISYPILIVWAIMWLIAFAFRQNIHFSNFASTLLTAILSFSSADVLNRLSNTSAQNNLEYSIPVSIILIIILTRHIEPIKIYIKQQAEKSRKD